jgi:hypothetical protein
VVDCADLLLFVLYSSSRSTRGILDLGVRKARRHQADILNKITRSPMRAIWRYPPVLAHGYKDSRRLTPGAFSAIMVAACGSDIALSELGARVAALARRTLRQAVARRVVAHYQVLQQDATPREQNGWAALGNIGL